MVKANRANETPTAEQDEAGLWKKKGDALFEEGNYEAALESYKYANEIDPTEWRIWNNQGFSLFKLGRKDEARKCKEKSLELKNNPPVITTPAFEELSVIEENPIIPLSPSISPISQPIEETHIPIQEKSIESPPATATIYGISGSTQYLLNGIHPIHGKKLTNLEEIIQFYDNYENILEKTKVIVGKQQEEKISYLSSEEARLDTEMKDGIARRTQEVEGNISDLKIKIKETRKFFPKLKYQFQYLIENNLRSYRIESPFTVKLKELKQIRKRKSNLISNKQNVVRNEYYNVIVSYQFLEQNKAFFIGARGEELVIDYLSRLSNEYHVLNNVNLRFRPPIRWKKKNDYIISSQIDHIVIGPTGVFLVETKNWKSSDVDLKSEKLISQVRRSNYALWRYLIQYYRRDTMPRIWNVIVATHGVNSNKKLDKYIDIITPNQLSRYITQRETTLSPEGIKRLTEIIQKCC